MFRNIPRNIEGVSHFPEEHAVFFRQNISIFQPFQRFRPAYSMHIPPFRRFRIREVMSEYTFGSLLRIPDVKNVGSDLALEELRISPSAWWAPPPYYTED